MEVDGEKLDDADVQHMRDAIEDYERKRSQELGDLDDDSGDDDDADFGEESVPEPETSMPTPQDSMPNEINGVPMQRRTLM
eukprot:8407594-Karenia_brevis.AAC.1